MILNRNNFPYFNSHVETGVVWKNNTAYFDLKEWNDFDYWFCEIFLAESLDSINITSFIPEEILKNIREDQHTFLVLCNSHEAFHEIVEKIYLKIIIDNHIPAKKIILMSESADIDKEVKFISNKYNLDEIQSEWTLVFEYVIKNYTYRNWKLITDQLALAKKNKFERLFINLNRRWRPHRPLFVALLNHYNLLDKGYVSLAKNIENRSWDNMYDWISSLHLDNQDISHILSKDKKVLFDMPDLFVDTTDLHNNKADKQKDTDVFYKNSFLSVVSETNFYTSDGFNKARFLSEKTFKPVMYRHPFIMISVPGSLDTFRFLGYQTFEPFIDESYDLEINDSLRLLKIINELIKLNKMSSDDFLDLAKELIPIIEYNFFHLIEREKYIYKKT